MAKSIQSIEPNIADLANGWLKSHKLPYKLEQESVNAEIDKALSTTSLKMAEQVQIDQMQKYYFKIKI